ncbi:hypothetical protein PHMEG_00033691 [Phytophthora megakarya]|uniref:Uncharacterized protein n=1 Tax=Phytophthora megakarya TaxID=4795 RepID=A0A225USG9_9STRA|nr:hypothetical protein PHMEG_00033691 [Phytophthora megakarya]
MSLSAFVPANTQKARTTAISSFVRMLEDEGVSMEFFHASILNDPSGTRLAATMDRFGYYLATNDGKKARSSSDYQDAALACLMWHCFGRSSDLGYLRKQHVSVSADGVFYLRLLRVKTAEEQGLTLIPDKDDFLTCPIHSLAVALVMQTAPCSALLSQLPQLATASKEQLVPRVSLHNLLEAEPALLSVAPMAPSTATAAPAPNCRPSPGPTSVAAQVSSSTKSSAEEKARGEDGVQARGGAQHANGDDRLAAQWIFDRGAWDMSKVNKGFAYVYNTPREDRKVARVLSGWEADAARTCTGLTEHSLNVSSKVLTVLTAYLVCYYPQLKALAPGVPVVQRVGECLDISGISAADSLALSVALNEQASPAEPVEEQEQKETHTCQGALLTSKQKEAPKEQLQEQDTLDQEPRPKRRKKAATNLSNAWFEWYTRVPRVWNSADRQKKSEYHHVIAFMKLFLTEGFALDPNAPDYKDQVLDTGRRAETAVIAFLKSRNVDAKGAGSVLRALRPLHKSGRCL